MAVGAGEDLDDAGVGEADLGALPQADAAAERADHRRGRDAAGLDVAGQADAAQLALGLRGRAPAGEARVVGELERLVERGLVVAGVVHQRDRRLIGEGVLGDEVLAPQLRRIAPGLTGRGLDDGLEQIGRLRPPGAAVGVDRRRVGVDRIDRAMDRRRLVLPGEQGGVEIGRDAGREGRQIGAHVRDRVDLQRGEVAVGIERQLGLGDVVAAMGVGEEALAALGGPLDRPAEPLGGEQADALLGVDEDLGAEAAADVGRDHPELVLGRDADERRDHQARDVRVLARGVEREARRWRDRTRRSRRAARSRSAPGGC